MSTVCGAQLAFRYANVVVVVAVIGDCNALATQWLSNCESNFIQKVTHTHRRVCTCVGVGYTLD